MRFAALLLVGCMDPAPSPRVTVTGTVRDGMNEPVADVDVVFRGSRDATAKTGPDGTYQLQLLAGEYRAFVRGDSVLSVGRTDRSRLPGLPEAVAAGALDEALLPTITLAHDASGMDLEVMRAGVITGTVFDTEARPVMGVVVSAHGATELSPTTGTDITITRRDGTFELRVPHGDHRLAMTHPAFADTVDAGSLDVRGGTRHVSLTLAKGCVIAGKVVDARGRPARGGSNEASTEGMVEGSIERRLGLTDLDFAPVARSHADGTFRFTTVERGDIVLRAWPWHRPPSETKRFACKDGARFTTTFRIPERAPDLAGTLVD
ncbi:MAG TPA: carboxypeptidase regulatory-like domain-containing protein, partial [Kofleriaceae bacterium]|nr:carboxypeptidase regulatory-like domain-containing protein [Kofleriaceae bacterium]